MTYEKFFSSFFFFSALFIEKISHSPGFSLLYSSFYLGGKGILVLTLLFI